MLPVLAISLLLQGSPAVDGGPRLLEHALVSPVDEGGGAGEAPMLWRVPGAVGGGLLGAGLGMAAGVGARNDGAVLGFGLSGLVLGSAGGYFVGRAAENDSGVARLGILGVCGAEVALGALYALMFVLISGGTEE